MLELELDNAEGILEDFDPKGDREGKFAYLKISFGKLPADVLDCFEPGPKGLKDRMFRMEKIADLAGGEALVVRDTGEIYPQCRSEEMGGLLKIGYGVTGPMHFPSAALDEFKITPQDGGRVILAMRIKVRPDEGQAGKLYMLNKGPVSVSLEPLEIMQEAA